MALNTSSATFTTAYEAQVHDLFQQLGSKAMNSVRLKRGVVGSTAVFPTYGTADAVQSTPQAEVTPVQPVHAPVTATMEDWGVPIYVSTLDELKTNIDERRAAATAGAGGLGRKVDGLIFTALDATTTEDTTIADGLTKARILSATETLNDNDVPNDGRRYGAVGSHQWSELMNLSEFKSSDFVGQNQLPWATGPLMKDWLGVKWYQTSLLPTQNSAAERKCFVYHQDAIALGVAKDVTVDINYIPTRRSWLIDHYMSMGAILIESTGIVEIQCDDDEAIS